MNQYQFNFIAAILLLIAAFVAPKWATGVLLGLAGTYSLLSVVSVFGEGA